MNLKRRAKFRERERESISNTQKGLTKLDKLDRFVTTDMPYQILASRLLLGSPFSPFESPRNFSSNRNSPHSKKAAVLSLQLLFFGGFSFRL